MADDIVKSLRAMEWENGWFERAADEIERLRAENGALSDAMKAANDEAVRLRAALERLYSDYEDIVGTDYCYCGDGPTPATPCGACAARAALAGTAETGNDGRGKAGAVGKSETPSGGVGNQMPRPGSIPGATPSAPADDGHRIAEANDRAVWKLRGAIGRAYLRLQCADVPRGPWHDEVSGNLLAVADEGDAVQPPASPFIDGPHLEGNRCTCVYGRPDTKCPAHQPPACRHERSRDEGLGYERVTTCLDCGAKFPWLADTTAVQPSVNRAGPMPPPSSVPYCAQCGFSHPADMEHPAGAASTTPAAHDAGCRMLDGDAFPFCTCR